MAPTDPHQGGDLFDIAQKGQRYPMMLANEHNSFEASTGETGEGPTKATDIPRSFQDQGSGEEVQIGTGYVPNNPRNKNIVPARV